MAATLKCDTIVADGGTPNNITMDTAGNVTIGNGLTLAGALNAASVTATGAVNGASVTATNALTGKSLVLNGSTSGTTTILPSAVAGTTTATLPARTANVMLDGPAFSAYLSATQNIASSTYTKVNFDVEEFDTNSNFAAGRFTPTVAGYYQVNATVYGTVTNTTSLVQNIYVLYKNGAAYKFFYTNSPASPQGQNCASGSFVVYMNGTTDYLEVYGYINGTGTQFSGTSVSSSFSGSLIRGA